jgi:hypothetical protein
MVIKRHCRRGSGQSGGRQRLSRMRCGLLPRIRRSIMARGLGPVKHELEALRPPVDNAHMPWPTSEPGRQPQRRHATREPLDAPASVFAEMQPHTAAHQVRVFNISTAGVGYHSSTAAAVGSIWRIQIATDKLNVNSRLRVTRCHKQGDGYDVGGVFLEN